MKIYCAGKVTKHGWRDSLCNIRGMASGSCHTGDPYEIVGMPKLPNGWSYGGPVLVSCDHGCYHGEGKHGQIDTDADHPRGQERSEVFRQCMKFIERCDAVFAWIDSPEVEGTLFELGYASALGKPIVIGFQRDLSIDSFWFARQGALVSGTFDDVGIAYRVLSERLESFLAEP